jgi:hypothetical protein
VTTTTGNDVTECLVREFNLVSGPTQYKVSIPVRFRRNPHGELAQQRVAVAAGKLAKLTQAF